MLKLKPFLFRLAVTRQTCIQNGACNFEQPRFMVPFLLQTEAIKRLVPSEGSKSHRDVLAPEVAAYKALCQKKEQQNSDFFTSDMSEWQFFEKHEYTPEETGLPMEVLVSTEEGFDEGTFPCVRVIGTYATGVMRGWPYFFVTIEDHPKLGGATGMLDPRDVQKAVDWVRLNKTALLNIWNQDCEHDDCHFAKV